jgi:hypothetical protein
LGDRSLYSGTLSGQGIAPRAIYIGSTAISIDVAVSYDEEGVVLPGLRALPVAMCFISLSQGVIFM